MLVFPVASYATIWRVNNNGDLTADFQELSSAVTSSNVLAGDTIHLEGSSTRYGTATINKRLVIIGPGYFLNENPQTQADNLEAVVSVQFQNGAQGTVLQGLTLRIRVSVIALSVNDLVITGCRFTGSTQVTAENILFTGNYFESGVAIEDNITFRNNYFAGSISKFSGKPECRNCILEHNIVAGFISMSNSSIRNYIFTAENTTSSLISGSANTIANNLTSLNQLGVGNGNLQNVDLSTVFVGSRDGSIDGQWMLKENSPAIAAGVDGVDIGMFGDSTPYKLSGIPDIPHIVELTVPSKTSQEAGLTITLKSN